MSFQKSTLCEVDNYQNGTEGLLLYGGVGVGLWCLKPRSTLFQLYRAGQFYWPLLFDILQLFFNYHFTGKIK